MYVRSPAKTKITSTQLILDFGLMCDALQELSELNLDSQERNIVRYEHNEQKNPNFC
jgi:hypothetical protein